MANIPIAILERARKDGKSARGLLHPGSEPDEQENPGLKEPEISADKYEERKRQFIETVKANLSKEGVVDAKIPASNELRQQFDKTIEINMKNNGGDVEKAIDAAIAGEKQRHRFVEAMKEGGKVPDYKESARRIMRKTNFTPAENDELTPASPVRNPAREQTSLIR